VKTDDYCRFRIREDKPPEHLERQCDIPTAVDVERYHTALEPVALHRVQQLCPQDRAGCTNGMAMRSLTNFPMPLPRSRERIRGRGRRTTAC
jgi:hypothetical protein